MSQVLLERHQRFEACPALAFENSREGFQALVERMRALAPLEHYTVLLVKNGPLPQSSSTIPSRFEDIPVFVMHVQERPSAMMKTDKRDALGLANTLYNHVALGVQVSDKTRLVRKAFPPSPAAAQLKGFIRHRYELVQEFTQRKNKLIAICDELFPEFHESAQRPHAPYRAHHSRTFPNSCGISHCQPAQLFGKREAKIGNSLMSNFLSFSV